MDKFFESHYIIEKELRKAKDCLKQGIRQLGKYINRFEQTPEEDACIEMHETVLEIDKILGGMDK